MAKGNNAGSRSSAKYASASRWTINKVRNVKREITKANAKIRQIDSRVKRGVISEAAAAAPIARQQKHIQNLETRLEIGFERGGYATKLAAHEA